MTRAGDCSACVRSLRDSFRGGCVDDLAAALEGECPHAGPAFRPVRQKVSCPLCREELGAAVAAGGSPSVVAQSLGDACPHTGAEAFAGPTEAEAGTLRTLDDLQRAFGDGPYREAPAEVEPAGCVACKGVGTVMVPCGCAGRHPGCMWCEGDGQVEAACPACAAVAARLVGSSDGANDDGDDDGCF